MSKVAVKPNASGTGVFTLEAPATNTDRTLNLPDEAGTVLTNASDISAANLTGDVAAERITGALNATGSAPVYACRAWVNFNGTGTVSIRGSGNVSSITDIATGNYTVNFSTAMPDTNYAACVSGTSVDNIRSNDSQEEFILFFTTSVRLLTSDNSGSGKDYEICCVSVFR